jgi:hypothetical protein
MRKRDEATLGDFKFLRKWIRMKNGEIGTDCEAAK